MKKLEFKFDSDCFNKLFPFYILINSEFKIEGIGKSLAKTLPSLALYNSFSAEFTVKIPHVEQLDFEAIRGLFGQLIVLVTATNGINLRGQFQEHEGSILFVGTPWFVAMEEMGLHNLTFHDFALHDPLLDLLHALKTQEISTYELKEVLTKVNSQKKSLNKDKEELNRLSLVASANENGVVFTHPNGIIFWCNEAYLKHTGFTKEEVIGNTPIQIGQCDRTDKDELKKMTIPFFSGAVFDVELIHGRKDKSSFWAKIKGQPILDAAGKVVQYFAMIEDITKKKEQDEQLYLLSLIAEKNINAVVVADKFGRIEWANSSFKTMSGYSNEELVGRKPGHLLQGPKTNLETVKYLKNQIEHGLPFDCEIINYSKTGEHYWVKIQGQALYNKNGEIIKYFAIEEDVSERKLLENQREELLDSLAKTNKELEDYAQIVSHDLKSPLRSIHSLISWIKEDNEKELSSQTMQYFGLIENKVEKMDHLIGGILTYSKIDKIEIEKENVSTQQIIQNIINIIHIPTNIQVVIKGTLPVIQGDTYRIQQLFQNLIGNAVNYIEREFGLVEVSCQELQECHIFAVKDNGVGIAKENHKKIFNTFQSYTTSEHSTGLGLSIVKKIIDTYKGEIWVESELGVGTTFFVKLYK